MKRITITLPEELAGQLVRESRRRRESVSALVREAVAERYGAPTEGRRRLPFTGLGRSGRGDTARRAEEILEKEWPPDRRR